MRILVHKSPDQLDLHAKLLEVFHAAKNADAFEEQAQMLHEKIGGDESNSYWMDIVPLGREICPHSELFGGAGDDFGAGVTGGYCAVGRAGEGAAGGRAWGAVGDAGEFRGDGQGGRAGLLAGAGGFAGHLERGGRAGAVGVGSQCGAHVGERDALLWRDGPQLRP